MGADGLFKREVFSTPDPFAIVTVDGEQTHNTQPAKKTVTPYWGEEFQLCVPALLLARPSRSLMTARCSLTPCLGHEKQHRHAKQHTADSNL